VVLKALACVLAPTFYLKRPMYLTRPVRAAIVMLRKTVEYTSGQSVLVLSQRSRGPHWRSDPTSGTVLLTIAVCAPQKPVPKPMK
jgi:hypothetical protein